MLRDAVIIDLNDNTELIITTDGCTGVGGLKEDIIKLDLRIVAWTACKVALMELLSLGAKPIGFAFNHIASINDYELTKIGMEECFIDFGFDGIPYISSSEKNFQVSQTTITVALTGVRDKIDRAVPEGATYILIGDPLVGYEVLEYPDRLITPKEFSRLLELRGVYEIIPIGSHGVMQELEIRGLIPNDCGVDLNKSAGPASCVLAALNTDALKAAEKIFGNKLRIASYGLNKYKDGDEVPHA